MRVLDDEIYRQYLKKQQDDYEALCSRCGACCGVFENDPCVKLVLDQDGRYRCSDYENRFGEQKTVNGNEFNCVTVRDILCGSWPGSWRCQYKRRIFHEGTH